MPLSKFARAFVIIQLCIAFMMLMWYLCYPFMGELYHWRSHLFLAQTVVGDTQLLDYVDDKEIPQSREKLESNQRLFSKLPKSEQDSVLKDLKHYQSMLKKGWKQKLASSFDIFLNHLPPFKEAWLIFTFIVCFSLLYRVEGAHLVVWALPVLTLGYIISSSGYPSGLPPDAHLFPVENTLNETTPETFSKAWNDYMEKEWGGDFFFNLARLKEYRSHPGYHSAYRFKHQEPLALLFLYFAWNLSFAYICCKCKKQLKTASIQP